MHDEISRNNQVSSQPQSSSNIDHVIAGAVSGFVTRFTCQPLDVIKIRFQLQVEPIAHDKISKYRSMPQACALIIKEEGVTALWKGHVPAQLLSVVYGMGKFSSYNVLSKLANDYTFHDRWQHVMHFVSGAGAGIFATVVSFPFDTVRTRLVAQSSNRRVYHGILHCGMEILSTETPKTFFRGLWPTLLQIAPHSGLQFACYSLFTDIYNKYTDHSSTNFASSMVAGSAAGLVAKTIVYPLDLARKRLQIQGFEHGRKGFGKFFRCNGFLDCLTMSVKSEGLRGLFKGLWPSQLKAAATTALHFTTYEQALILLKTLQR